MTQARRQLRCDLCLVANPNWEFPCRDFEMGVPDDRRPWAWRASRGSWLACDTCHVLITSSNRNGLQRHVMHTLRRHGWFEGVDTNGLGLVARALREGHDDFWANREGPPTRITPKQRAEYEAEPEEDPPEWREGPPRMASWLRDLYAR